VKGRSKASLFFRAGEFPGTRYVKFDGTLATGLRLVQQAGPGPDIYLINARNLSISIPNDHRGEQPEGRTDGGQELTVASNADGVMVLEPYTFRVQPPDAKRHFVGPGPRKTNAVATWSRKDISGGRHVTAAGVVRERLSNVHRIDAWVTDDHALHLTQREAQAYLAHRERVKILDQLSGLQVTRVLLDIDDNVVVMFANGQALRVSPLPGGELVLGIQGAFTQV
jgi:hypothetical protein